MKTIRLILTSCLLSCAVAVVAAAPSYSRLSARLATQFLSGAKTTSEDQKKFIEEEDIVGADFIKAFNTAVTAGREIVKQGTPATNKNFAGLVAESLGVTVADGAAPSHAAHNAESEPADREKGKKARQALIDGGLAAFARHASQTQKIYLLRAFGVTLSSETDWKAFSAQKPDGSYDPSFEDFLVRLGASGKKRAAAFAEKAKAAGKAAADAPGLSATEQQATAKAGGDKPVEKDANPDTKLRSAGFSFSQGVGVVQGKQAASVGTLIVRWNALQRRTTLKWNELVNYGSRKGGDYQQVEYFGSRGAALVEDQLTPNASIARVNGLLDFNVLCPTAIGPFFGGGMVGERVKFGKDSTGADKLERPYLLGLSLGWGFYDEAGSAFYLDLGSSVSPTSGFKHSRPFIGISFDAIVLGKITGFIRKSATAAPATNKPE